MAVTAAASLPAGASGKARNTWRSVCTSFSVKSRASFMAVVVTTTLWPGSQLTDSWSSSQSSPGCASAARRAHVAEYSAPCSSTRPVAAMPFTASSTSPSPMTVGLGRVPCSVMLM